MSSIYVRGNMIINVLNTAQKMLKLYFLEHFALDFIAPNYGALISVLLGINLKLLITGYINNCFI
jgi:hypothetical protein